MAFSITGSPVYTSPTASARQTRSPRASLRKTPGDTFHRRGMKSSSSLTKPNLFQRLFQPNTAKQSHAAKTPVIRAGAQHDREEPRNPIPFEALDDMIKSRESEVAPRVGSLMKRGYAGSQKHLLKVANQMLHEMNDLTDTGHEDVELVLFYDNPSEGSLRDPFSQQSYAYSMNSEKQEVCMIPTPLRLFKKFDALNHWSTIAQGKQPMPDLEYLAFEPQELDYLKETAQNHRKAKPEHRFDLSDKGQLADYAFQLFNMLYNVQLAREEMPLEAGNDNPAHYKVGIRSYNPEGKKIIQDISHLFPGCDLKGPESESGKSIPLFLDDQRAYLEKLFSRDSLN